MATQAQARWISTTQQRPWRESWARPAGRGGNLTFSGAEHQTMTAFGGCFNELGWIALKALPPARRRQVLAQLFDPTNGCRFSLCRLPIGASDYAAEWYSHNEHDGDFAMRQFSIARDRDYLIPYIRQAQALRPDLRLFASPWSPPTWMKRPKAYNHGTFVMAQKYLKAYAVYFRKFVEAYRKEGLTINQLHPQNEPLADQKFPSCLWTGEQMATFIGGYLGPELKRAGLDTEVWLGTLNTDDFNGWPRTVLSHPTARRYVRGVGLQWAGKGMVQRLAEAYPAVSLMQTENECGDGQNSWPYAEYIFELMRHYLDNGVSAYIYWNMILAPGGRSTWGWKQNAMITVDPATGKVTLNPEFYVMKHVTRFVDPGAVRLGLAGEWTGNAVAFRNPNGRRVVVAHNPFATPAALAIAGGCRATLPPHSFNTFVLPPGSRPG